MPVSCSPKSIVPKFARGRTPPEEGASAIHSAEDRWAEGTFAEVLNDCPVVVSVIVTVKLRLEYCTFAYIMSPG